MRIASLCLLIGVTACARYEFAIPAPTSPPPVPTTAQLHAGFARVDMTPPPGGGLMGYATEGKRSRGHRMRLYARALVLEDEGGERIALVLADLGSVSPLLHRLAARRIVQRTGIGADRLFLIASHTHSAPGHYYATPAYDEQASRVQGFDSTHAVFVAERIALAVIRASGDKRPARAAWGFTNVWNQTRVRDFAMTERNPSRFVHPSVATAELPSDPRYRYIDPQLNMLRVDVRNSDGVYEPAGSFMMFAIHGTLNSGSNELIDGDVHTIVAQHLEQRIGRRAQRPGDTPQTIHLFANAAAGDVTAAVSDLTRCPAPTYGDPFLATGPRRPLHGADSVPRRFPPYPECLTLGREAAVRVGTALGEAALALHKAMDSTLAQETAEHVRIARVFDVIDMSRLAVAGLCRPHAGPNTIPGPEGSHTRLINIAFLRATLGMDTLPLPPVRDADNDDCQGVKPDLDAFEYLVGGRKPYPLQLQFAVLRIGAVTIGTVPAEPTTNAGWLMRRIMAGSDTANIYQRYQVLSLTNGYAQYVTTQAEYGAQMYEGASTLYGPHTASAIAQHLRTLVTRLPAAGSPSPAVEIGDVQGIYRKNKAIVPRERAMSLPVTVRLVDTCFRGDTLIATWNDDWPGNIVPAEGALVRIDRRSDDGFTIVTWDDDPYLEVWHLGWLRTNQKWQLRYAPARPARGSYRAVLLERGSLPEVTGAWLEWGERTCS